MNRFYTSSALAGGHPELVCSQIAENIVDACLARDPEARTDCQVTMAGRKILALGAVSSHCQPDISAIIRSVAAQAGFPLEAIENRIQFTSPAAFQQAGGQCIATGYACNETPELLPLALVLARRLDTKLALARKTGIIPGLLPGGNAQVTVEYDGESPPFRLACVALETAYPPDMAEDEFFYELTGHVLAPALEILPPDEDTRILLRPAEPGTLLPHSSGPLSGKDPSWPEKAGRYMARYIAKNLVAAGLCDRCEVTLAYAKGSAESVVDVDTFGTATACADDCLGEAAGLLFDLNPAEIARWLKHWPVSYSRAAAWPYLPGMPWERLDQAKLLKMAIL